MTKRNRSRGFTLVELLVVIAIIGMLAGLMLPAVQQAREAGRRAECTNNQRNVALACINYEGARQAFPGFRQKASDIRDASWYVTIFPYIEQTNLYDVLIARCAANAANPNYGLGNAVSDTADGKGNYTNHAIAVFKCSSAGDRDNERVHSVANCGPTNVIASGKTWMSGSTQWTGNAAALDAYGNVVPVTATNDAATPVTAQFEPAGGGGVFFNKAGQVTPNTSTSVSLEYITSKNGTSNTLLVSENLQAGNWYSNTEDYAGFCFPDIWGRANDSNPLGGSNFETTSINEPADPLVSDGFPYWINAGKTGANLYGYRRSRPSSNHPGIVMSAFCDGSVRPVSDGTRKEVFRAAMQPGGSGVFGANDFNN
ncbi:MAG: DUF1559 domain-containing protein [Thermoguttaceae bacterium]